jgi:hypothetical protein
MKYEIIKGSEKDFEQAPEWATQILRDNNDSKKSFVGELGGVTLVAEKMNPHSWWKYNDGYVGTIIAERRPITEPVWSGEGLPPVGVEVDIVDIHERLRYGQNESGEVVAHVENTAVVRMSYGLGCFEAEFLRPIRSPEDVARDEAIDAMMKNSCVIKEITCGLLYDAIAAGKIPGITLSSK